MKYQDVLKQNAKFTVPEALFNEKFAKFDASYGGTVNGHDAPSWRAFEIAFKQGKLDGDTRPDNKKNRRSSKASSGSSSETSSDGSEQMGTSGLGETEA